VRQRAFRRFGKSGTFLDPVGIQISCCPAVVYKRNGNIFRVTHASR